MNASNYLRIASLTVSLAAVVEPVPGQVLASQVASQELVERDLQTLDWKVVGPTDPVGVSGLAGRLDGDLFAVSYFSDDLWRIDPDSGASERVGDLGFDLDVASGLTFDACDRLWMTSENALYRVDPGSGVATFMATVTATNQPLLALTAHGESLVAVVQLGVGTARQLAWIDPETGGIQYFGDLVFLPTFQVGLDFDDAGGLWAFYWMDGPIPGPWQTSVVEYDGGSGAVLQILEDVLPPHAGNLAVRPPGGACSSTSVVEIPAAGGGGLLLLASFFAMAGCGVLAARRYG